MEGAVRGPRRAVGRSRGLCLEGCNFIYPRGSEKALADSLELTRGGRPRNCTENGLEQDKTEEETSHSAVIAAR